MQPDPLEFWIDVNLPAIFSQWIRDDYNLKAKTFRELNFHKTKDYEVFKKAAESSSIVVVTTKDYDFVTMTVLPGNKLPKVLYMNIGNVTNQQLRTIYDNYFQQALQILSKTQQQLVEITNEL